MGFPAMKIPMWTPVQLTTFTRLGDMQIGTHRSHSSNDRRDYDWWTVPMQIVGVLGNEPMKKLVLISLVLLSSLAFAHSGGTDKNGCHNDRKAGTRHCH